MARKRRPSRKERARCRRQIRMGGDAREARTAYRPRPTTAPHGATHRTSIPSARGAVQSPGARYSSPPSGPRGPGGDGRLAQAGRPGPTIALFAAQADASGLSGAGRGAGLSGPAPRPRVYRQPHRFSRAGSRAIASAVINTRGMRPGGPSRAYSPRQTRGFDLAHESGPRIVDPPLPRCRQGTRSRDRSRGRDHQRPDGARFGQQGSGPTGVVLDAIREAGDAIGAQASV